MPFLCSKGLKMRVPEGKSAQKCRFCARGWLPRAQQRCHEPCGVHLAAVRQATDCRNLPRNLPPCMLPGTAPRATYRRGATAEELPQKATAVCYRRHAYPSDNLPAVHAAATCRQDLPTAHTAGELPQKPTAVCYRRHACRRGTCCQDLPAAHTTVHTAVALPPRRYRKKLPPCAVAGTHTPGKPTRLAYYLTLGPAPSGRVIRM